MADCPNCAAERARADAALLRLDKSVAGNHDLARLHEAALARAEGAENRAEAAELQQEETAESANAAIADLTARAEAAEAARAKLTEALRAAWADLIRVLSAFHDGYPEEGLALGNALRDRLAHLTSAALASANPEPPKEEVK